MQTDEQKHKDTYEHGRQGEDEDGAGRVSRPGGEGQTKGEGCREGRSERRDGERGHKGGVSIVLAECGQEAQYTTDPLDVTVRERDLIC